MTRAHFSRPLQADSGALIKNASIRLLAADGTSTLNIPVYVDDAGSSVRTNPWDITDGFIDFYLDDQTRLNLGVTIPGQPERVFRNVDVVATDSDLVAIGRAVPTAGSTLKATGPGQWSIIPLTPYGETLLAAPSALAARGALEVYSKSEVNTLAVPQPEAGYAKVDNSPFTSPSPNSSTFGHASGVVAPLQTTVVGIGRPAIVEAFLPGLSHPLVSGNRVNIYVSLTLLANGVGTPQQVVGIEGVASFAPTESVHLWTRTPVLVAGTSYTYAVSLMCGNGGTATIIAGSGSKAEIQVRWL